MKKQPTRLWIWENDKETLGQWLIRDEATDNRDIVATIPRIGDEDYDNSVMLPVARLIAAAPELLEACKTALRLPYPWINTVQKRKEKLKYDEFIKAAIAKATGENA